MSKKQTSIKNITLSAVMAAVYFLLDYIATNGSSIFGGSLKISLSALPVIIVAVFLGPVWGGLTGFIGAFLGQIVAYGFTPMTLLWVLPAVARGVSVGLMLKLFKEPTKPLNLIIVTCISSVLVTVLNTAAKLVDFAVYGAYYPGAPESYWAVMVEVPQRLAVGIVTAIILSLMLPTIIDALKKVIK